MKCIALLFVVMTTSCCTNVLQKPAENVVDTIIPEYIEYVKNDPKFLMKPDRQLRRINAAKSFKEAVDVGRDK